MQHPYNEWGYISCRRAWQFVVIAVRVPRQKDHSHVTTAARRMVLVASGMVGLTGRHDAFAHVRHVCCDCLEMLHATFGARASGCACRVVLAELARDHTVKAGAWWDSRCGERIA